MKRKIALLSWRLRLQTSGIYRDPAIPCCLSQKPERARIGPLRHMVWPRKSALRLRPRRALPSAPVSTSVGDQSWFEKRVVVADREK